MDIDSGRTASGHEIDLRSLVQSNRDISVLAGVKRKNAAQAVAALDLADDARGGHVDADIVGDAGLARVIVNYFRTDGGALIDPVPVAPAALDVDADVDDAPVRHRDSAARARLR